MTTQKTISILSALLLTFGLLSFVPKGEKAKATLWSLDKSHSSLTFEINHFFTPVKGSFDEFNGKLVFDPSDLANSSADFTVSVASVNTQNEKRDGHLQTADFFNSAEWPQMHFVSKEINHVNDNEYVITGFLTIRNVTKEIELPFTLLGVQEHPMKKGYQMAGIRAETTINRNDYGVGTGSYAATAVVGGDVKISILMETMREVNDAS